MKMLDFPQVTNLVTIQDQNKAIVLKVHPEGYELSFGTDQGSTQTYSEVTNMDDETRLRIHEAVTNMALNELDIQLAPEDEILEKLDEVLNEVLEHKEDSCVIYNVA